MAAGPQDDIARYVMYAVLFFVGVLCMITLAGILVSGDKKSRQ